MAFTHLDQVSRTVCLCGYANRSDPGFFLREAAKLGEEYEIERQVLHKPIPQERRIQHVDCPGPTLEIALLCLLTSHERD